MTTTGDNRSSAALGSAVASAGPGSARAAAPLRITPLVVPLRLDSPDAGAFLEMVDLGNASWRYEVGHDDLAQDPLEALGHWQDDSDRTHAGFLAYRSEALVGAVAIETANEAHASTLEFDLMIDPERRGEGIEQALLDVVDREARARGRGTVQTYSLHRSSLEGRRVVPSTGWGSVPADDLHTRVLVDGGYTLEQVERTSAFDLLGAFDTVEAMLAEALAIAGEEYRVVAWTDTTPEEFLDTFAYAMSRMSTDVPQGGLTIDPEIWDADRVRRRDARQRAQGMTVSVSAVQHVPSGALVAFNELVIGADRAGATQQYGTLVLREHRGRRLGTVVKCANLLRWRDIAPDSPRVSTFNAEENRHMLDINERLGFVPVSYSGAWKKVIAEAVVTPASADADSAGRSGSSDS